MSEPYRPTDGIHPSPGRKYVHVGGRDVTVCTFWGKLAQKAYRHASTTSTRPPSRKTTPDLQAFEG